MPSAYDALVRRLQRISGVSDAASLLHWDQETTMPAGGVTARASTLGVLEGLAHEMLVADETGRLLREAEAEETEAARRAQLREVRWRHDRAARVPSSLVEETSVTSSRALDAWKAARARSDFAAFAPHLGRLVELRKRYAELVAPDARPYEALFQDYEPYLPLDATRRMLQSLRDGLRPIALEAAALPAHPLPAGPFSREAQHALSLDVLRALGYDLEHGRLDVSAHPFSSGNPYDARITTRWDEDDFLSGLLSTVHEAGHAMYEQGLPREHWGTPLGEARDLVAHESQSRLWENHVGRSRAFWDFATPLAAKRFPAARGLDAEACWRAVNRIRPSLIRVEADEVTYHVHIALRFEIEEGLFEGGLDVREVPQAWNDAVQKHLGLVPESDADGCLQDVHWSLGAFGYFPTYSLGSMFAAQLHETWTRQAPEAEEAYARGEFRPLLAWLRERVHGHGKRWTTTELVERATGSPLSHEPLLRHARRKAEALAAA